MSKVHPAEAKPIVANPIVQLLHRTTHSEATYTHLDLANQALASIAQAIVMIDLEDQIQYCNPTAEQLIARLNVAPADWHQQNWYQILPLVDTRTGQSLQP